MWSEHHEKVKEQSAKKRQEAIKLMDYCECCGKPKSTYAEVGKKMKITAQCVHQYIKKAEELGEI